MSIPPARLADARSGTTSVCTIKHDLVPDFSVEQFDSDLHWDLNMQTDDYFKYLGLGTLQASHVLLQAHV